MFRYIYRFCAGASICIAVQYATLAAPLSDQASKEFWYYFAMSSLFFYNAVNLTIEELAKEIKK